MSTTEQALPEAAVMAETICHVNDDAPRSFLWDYERSRPQLVTPYNKAMASSGLE